MADDLDKPLFGTAFLSMAVAIGSLFLSALTGNPLFVGYGIALALAGAGLAWLIVLAAYVLTWIEQRRWPSGTPDPDNPFAVIVWR